MKNSSITFEWDEQKNERNKAVHGIGFEDAVFVFHDPNYIEFFDEQNSINEDRYVVIGRVEKVILVVYTPRNDHFRLISARIASKKEEELYYDVLHIKFWR